MTNVLYAGGSQTGVRSPFQICDTIFWDSEAPFKTSTLSRSNFSNKTWSSEEVEHYFVNQQNEIALGRLFNLKFFFALMSCSCVQCQCTCASTAIYGSTETLYQTFYCWKTGHRPEKSRIRISKSTACVNQTWATRKCPALSSSIRIIENLQIQIELNSELKTHTTNNQVQIILTNTRMENVCLARFTRYSSPVVFTGNPEIR